MLHCVLHESLTHTGDRSERCHSVLQCVAVCCSALQCVTLCSGVLQSVAECCRVLQCVAVCCSVLQCVLNESQAHASGGSAQITTHSNTLQHTPTHCNALQCTATHCNTLQHTAHLVHILKRQIRRQLSATLGNIL